MTKSVDTNEYGHVVSFFQGAAKLEGLAHVFLHEMLVDQGGKPVALVVGFDERCVEALFFDESFPLEQPVYRGRKIFSLPIDQNIIGRSLNGLGRPLDALGPVRGKPLPVFREAPPIIDRAPVHVPLSTGIKIIDTVLPLGRGQRELIISDRKLGKSTLVLDTVLNQQKAQPPLICVYVLCGQKRQKLNEVLTLFEKHNAWLYTTVVAATAGSSFGELYLAPFVGCAIGEYWRDQGQDALVIYDDLSKHAKAYRDMALLFGRAPGRESYPGDIFSLHAKLLERAANLARPNGGSLTALPLLETQEGDITSFLSTNLISITDGQIYLARGLFQKGFIPAINIGLSVSRVGSKAQPPPLKEVTAGLRLALAQHKELQKLAQLETTKSALAQHNIHRGELLLELLKQEKNTNVSWVEQTILFYVIEQGYFDDLEKLQWRKFEKLFLELLRNRYPATFTTIKQDGLANHAKQAIENIVQDFKKEFIAK